jgi:hypothetical protein
LGCDETSSQNPRYLANFPVYRVKRVVFTVIFAAIFVGYHYNGIMLMKPLL